MKKIIICGSFVSMVCCVAAQSFEISPKIAFGTGRIYSGNLVESFKYRNDLDKDILTWDARQKFGFTFGIGACFQYNMNGGFSVLVEPAYNLLNQKIFIDYFKDGLDGNGDGDKKTITSQAIIKSTWLGFPLLVQYGLGENQKIRISGGLEFAFMGTPGIESDETKITEAYANYILVASQTEIARVSSTLDVFKSPRVNFIAGLGTTFRVSDRNLYLDFRYHLPVTKSAMYTTNGHYDDVVFKNNEVFDIWGKADAELDAPQFSLDDYRLGTMEFVFRYTLFRK